MRLGLTACASLFWLTACSPDSASRAGKACHADADCRGLTCVAGPESSADLAPLPLVCGTPTDRKAPGEACAHGSECALGICVLAGACVAPCSDETQCGAQQRCQPVYARAGNNALQTLQACVAMVDPPAGSRVKIEVQKHAATGKRDTLALPGIASQTLFVVEHLSDDSWPIPDASSTCRPPLCTQKLQVRDAAHSVLFDESAIGMQASGPKNPVANGDHVNPVTVLIPNGPRSVKSAAGYSLTLQSKVAGDLRLTTLSRTKTGHQLNLNVYYVGARDWTSTGDRGPMLLADALAEVDTILGQAGIFIGDVRQIDVRGKLLTEGTPLPDEVNKGFMPIKERYGVYPWLPELWKLGAGAGNVALDLFFVSDISVISGNGGDVGAISGGTPGPLCMHGTPGSGIAVSTDMMLLQNDPQAMARTLAHEISHMLGLFHVVEVDGSVRDPFDDTPACTIDHDFDGNGVLDAQECAGAGGDNLMFPTTSRSSTTLSAEQQAILRSALILE